MRLNLSIVIWQVNYKTTKSLKLVEYFLAADCGAFIIL